MQNAIDENARLDAARLAPLAPILAPRVLGGSLGVVAARYDIDGGRVQAV